MKKIRVLVANQPRLMRDLVVGTIADQPDIEIVGQLESGKDMMSAVATTKPEFVVVSLEKSNHLPSACAIVLRDNPQLKVIAISPNRNRTMVYWTSLEIKSHPIEASEDGVLNTLRSATQIPQRVIQ